MAASLPEPPDRRLIGAAHAVDPARPLPGAGGGLPAFVVLDPHGSPSGLMAVQVARAMPPRALALKAASGMTDGVLGPVGHGPGPVSGPAGTEAYYVFCPAPPGASVAAVPRAWSEAELLGCLLRPAVQTLARLADRGVTHRAIRPNNVFQPAPGQPVILGQAWAAPPAALQPALFEPPYSAMCLPCGRGEGAVADDIYALGALMVVLALGRTPLEDHDPTEIVRRKLEHGSFAAVTGDSRLPPTIADLARGMLAEDPEHRPTPALLLDGVAARARRVVARPPKRGQTAVRIGPWAAWDARGLAHALAAHQQPGLAALRNGVVDTWLRRSLGDATLAARLEAIVNAPPSDEGEARADAVLVMRAVAALDPLAPLCWRGIAVWPDGVGPALAAAQRADAPADEAGALIDLVASEAAGTWAAARAERVDGSLIRVAARQRRALLGARGPTGGPRRLAYALNPLLACDSPLLGGRVVARPADLLAALDARAARGEPEPPPPVDEDIAAFVAARAERPGEAETARLAVGDGAKAALARIELLATIQDRGCGAVPALARWLVASPEPLVAGWRNVATRARLAGRLGALAEAGQLLPLLSLLQDPAGRAADLHGAREAGGQLARIDAELARIEGGAGARAATARGLGQEAAAGIALGAVALAVALALFR
ncbi:MAG: serine/threonine-protein kinase [Acetobacteraceae bacterium]